MRSYYLVGTAQKGPFITGSNIRVAEMDRNLIETGRTFNSEIKDDKGSYEVNVNQIEQYAKVFADGFYFNEVRGELSDARIILQAIVDLEDESEINVNLITSIESKRVQHLVKSGVNFHEAKLQASGEIFDIFGFSSDLPKPSEALNITQDSKNDAILLAVSAIILGYHSEGELTELIAAISTDLEIDGLLDDLSLQSELVNQALLLNTNEVVENLQRRFNDIDDEIIINSFAEYIEFFITNTSFQPRSQFYYPKFVGTNVNLLSDTMIGPPVMIDFFIYENGSEIPTFTKTLGY